jgi:hypothetical protein
VTPVRPRAPARRDRGAAIVALATLLPLAACDFDKTAVPAGRERLVVHAVLNPRTSEQYILVEQALTGRVAVDTTVVYDPDDPIATGDGVPVTGAEVLLVHAETGDTAVATDEAARLGDGSMRGVYLVVNGPSLRPTLTNPDPPRNHLPIARGNTYHLLVRTPTAQVTGEMTVPSALPGRVGTRRASRSARAVARWASRSSRAWARSPPAAATRHR